FRPGGFARGPPLVIPFSPTTSRDSRFRRWKGSEKSEFSANVGESVGNAKDARVAAPRSEGNEVGPPLPLTELEDVAEGRAKGFVGRCRPDCSRSLLNPSMS